MTFSTFDNNEMCNLVETMPSFVFFLQEKLDKDVPTPFSLSALLFKHSYAYSYYG